MRIAHAKRKFRLEAAALLSAALLATLLTEPALGQGRAGGTLPCSPSLQPGTPGTTTTGEGQPHNPATAPDDLTSKLAQSGGVICPPAAVDPEMKLPTPEAGNTPVIPPPGSPGGDPGIQPR